MMNTPLLTVNTYAHSDLKISMIKKWSTCELRQILEQFKNVVIPGSCLNGRKKGVNMKLWQLYLEMMLAFLDVT